MPVFPCDFPSRFRTLLLMVLFTLGACSGGGGGGDGDSSDSSTDTGTGDSRSRNLVASITLGGLQSAWIDPVSLTMGGGNVNEMVFSSDVPIYIDGVRTGDTTYYEFDITGNLLAEGDYRYWFMGVWDPSLLGGSPSVVLPPAQFHAGAFPSGSYSFKISNPQNATATINIYNSRKDDTNLGSGALALNFFVYSLAGEANGLLDSESDAAIIQTYMNNIFGQAGINIGSINLEFRQDVNAFVQVQSEAGMLAFLETASRGSAGRSDYGINCFIMPKLYRGTLGLDGAIPGPGSVHGTAASGLIAQAASMRYAASGYSVKDTDQYILAKILAHEIGHYLGLFHTTERDGSAIPTLADTPKCTPENDTDDDGAVSGPECRGLGAESLMFWTFDLDLVLSGDFQIGMSSQESQVANTHPSVY